MVKYIAVGSHGMIIAHLLLLDATPRSAVPYLFSLPVSQNIFVKIRYVPCHVACPATLPCARTVNLVAISRTIKDDLRKKSHFVICIIPLRVQNETS
ncbi:hypothetical protein EV401DRAFT_151871 [Pisolithus croceorrhizus]|nr:hypothetical protein EV401DRAFT_151871 [Pisolithus croceorrhizus]